ncbi:MAG: helix-hairpin-helix domain-containing protein [Planctomycetales bacterium]|nr:helix-hairpin-helix domain-containing protein [Planctomycetales bacterium]
MTEPPPASQTTDAEGNNPSTVNSDNQRRDKPATVQDLGRPTQPFSSLPTEPEPDRTALWLRRTDQLVVGLLTTVAVVLFAVDYARISGGGSRPVEILRLPETEYQYKLDVNQATWVEWALLDGIGEILGKRIVADREKNGPFRSVEDVLRVRGIGPKTMAKMRPWLEVRDKDTVARSSVSDEKKP